MPSTKSSVRKLYDIFSPRERVQVVFLVIAALLTAFAQATGVASIFPFINVVMDPNVIFENQYARALYKSGNFQNSMEFITVIGVVVFVLVILSSIISAITLWAKTRFILNKNHSLSVRLLKSYLSKPYEYFLIQNSSEMSKNILSEIDQLTKGYLVAVFEIIVSGFTLVVMICLLFAIDVKITVISMVSLGSGYFGLTHIMKSKMTRDGEVSLAENTKRFQMASEALSSIKTTKVMNTESYFINNYCIHSHLYAKANIFGGVARELPKYVLEAVAFGGIVLMIIMKIMNGEQIQDFIPLLSLFAFAGYRMMPALHRLYYAYTLLFHYKAILDKIHEDMVGHEDSYINKPVCFEKSQDVIFANSIRLHRVSFSYQGNSEQVINNLSIKIPKNAVVGFVGTTGSGKTTLVDIILGLLIPQAGDIFIDDVLLTEDNRRAWQRKIGYVPQDVYLTDDTLRRNIAFGIEENDIDEAQIKRAAQIAALDEFIVNQLPEQYNTVIGERGVRLSGGQRQRIGLARALYRNPEVLILDEATSALDGATEDVVLQAIQSASQSRTVIMIAHRLNTLQDCSQIYLMGNGKIVGHGTYEELITQNKVFMDMAKIPYSSSNNCNGIYSVEV